MSKLLKLQRLMKGISSWTSQTKWTIDAIRVGFLQLLCSMDAVSAGLMQPLCSGLEMEDVGISHTSTIYR